MNDDELRERARERLLTAELRTVLAEPNPGVVASRSVGRQLYAAALVLLGIAVALGAAWLSRTTEPADRDAAQEPVFDPVDPWFEQEDPFRPGLSPARNTSDRGERGLRDSGEFVVGLHDGTSAELADILERPVVRRLALFNRNKPARIDPEQWRRLAKRNDLEVLWLSGPFDLAPEQLRELRLLPALRHLALVDSAATLDKPTARSLCELPMLRGLVLGMIDAKPEGVAGLAGLPHLGFVAMSRLRMPTETLLKNLASVRSLQAIVLEHDGSESPPQGTVLLELAALPNLQALGVGFWSFDDAALASLPAGLTYLALPSLERCTPAGIDRMRRLDSLRTLRLRSMTPGPLVQPLADLLPKLGLERFDCMTESPDPVIWTALHRMPKLRRLWLRATGEIETAIANCNACQHLEHLTLVGEIPSPEQLAPLRDHLGLRRITLVPDHRQTIEAEALTALRAAVRATVEMSPR